MGRYRKKPVEIDAIQWTGNMAEVVDWLREILRPLAIGRPEDWAAEVTITPAGGPGGTQIVFDLRNKPHIQLAIKTLEGTMQAYYGDWIIRGVKGEFYPCRSDIFEETYEVAEGP